VSATAGKSAAEPAAGAGQAQQAGELLGIGAAAIRAGVSERALRYYQQLGLLTPCGSTPGGLRRYSAEDLARVARIRQLQTLLGLSLDEIAEVLKTEDRLGQIRRVYDHGDLSAQERRDLVAESLRLQQSLRATVDAKRLAIEDFLADLDARLIRTRDFLANLTSSAQEKVPG